MASLFSLVDLHSNHNSALEWMCPTALCLCNLYNILIKRKCTCSFCFVCINSLFHQYRTASTTIDFILFLIMFTSLIGVAKVEDYGKVDEPIVSNFLLLLPGFGEKEQIRGEASPGLPFHLSTQGWETGTQYPNIPSVDHAPRVLLKWF